MKILIIENEEVWRKKLIREVPIIREMFAKDSASIINLANISAVINRNISTDNIKLAITDIFLTDEHTKEDWYKIAKELKRNNIPIVVLSEYFNEIDPNILIDMVNNYGVKGFFKKSEYSGEIINAYISNIFKQNQSVCNDEFINWLHISDIHFKNDRHDFDRSLLLEKFYQDIEALNFKPDILFITGDIAYSGKKEEYDRALLFLKTLCKKINISRNKVFLVPGNHDVNWEAISPIARNICQFHNQKDIIQVLTDPDSNKMIMTRLEKYKTFVEKFYPNNSRILKIFKEKYYYASKIKMKGKNIGIYGLNSVWTSGNNFIDNKAVDQKNLFVGQYQINDTLNMVNQNDIDLNIALMHHPLSFLAEFEEHDITTRLVNNFDFLLHGHLHKPDFAQNILPRGKLVTNPAGALYEDEDAINSYNYVQYDPNNRSGVIHFRKYSKLLEKWIKDIEITGDSHDGVYSFAL